MGWQVFAGSVVLVLLPLLVVCVLLCHRVPAAAGEVLAERWVLLAASLFALAAAFFLGRLVTASLGRLAAVAPPAGGERFTGQVDDLAARIRRVAEAARESAERVDAETRRRLSAEDFLQLYRQLFDNLGEGIVITDAQATILAVNSAFTAITGYKAHEVAGRTPWLLKSDRHDDAFYERIRQVLASRGSWAGEVWSRRADGTVSPQWLRIGSVRDEAGTVRYYFASCTEIGERKRRERQVAFLAHHDALTRLPNRAFLENRLARALPAHGGDSGLLLAVFFIDLDNFKNVNDVFGHRQGDELLVQVAGRLKSVLGRGDSLYRLGSDEFILLMERVESEPALYLTANRILAALKKPFTLEFRTIYVNASIGISRFPGDGDNPLELIRSADMAMHRAKTEGRNRYQLFTREMHEQLYERFRTENGIRSGLLHREFVVYYQPKVDIATRTTTSLEALIRWQKGGRLISPGVFIPVAEESSLIDDLCRHVLEATCQFHAVLQHHGVAVPVSVNIAPRQFLNIDFIDLLEDLLGRHRMDPHYLELEITETTAMRDVEHTLRIMEQIRRLGIRFSIDDFGTGYSSLGSLNRMPVSTLKIDKQFVQDLEQHTPIVATIIAISQQMHLNVVAEGVETEAQLLELAAMGCQEAQGYYFSRPLADTEILRYLAGERAGGAPGEERR
ncbi:EAL domain-containing protein [uncultured Desulfobulbus sp.]|uniref:putative bifunctional diguanylate cyclase/phosphodiesterase n=1 Tax=uncultured Desulfobulbus sp. TaxID=239745 RepID=UPI00260209B7|nr:EAL domain-containing protein [uncultured Desulfobulbus sp.]